MTEYHAVTRCYQRYTRKQNNASFMAVIKMLPCSYQVLPKIYKETKYCLIYGCYQDVTMQLPGVTKDIQGNKIMPHLWLLSRCYHAVTRCYQRYTRKQNNASFMAAIKTLPCSYQVLPKIYKETKYCLIYGCYQDVTMQLPGVTKDI